jgi:hypothetical protein
MDGCRRIVRLRVPLLPPTVIKMRAATSLFLQLRVQAAAAASNSRRRPFGLSALHRLHRLRARLTVSQRLRLPLRHPLLHLDRSRRRPRSPNGMSSLLLYAQDIASHHQVHDT